MERNAGLEPVPPVWKTGMLAIEHQFRKYHILPTSYFTLVPMGPVLLRRSFRIQVLIEYVIDYDRTYTP